MSSSQKYFFSVSIHTYISRVKSKMQRLSKEAIFQASPVDNEKKNDFHHCQSLGRRRKNVKKKPRNYSKSNFLMERLYLFLDDKYTFIILNEWVWI